MDGWHVPDLQTDNSHKNQGHNIWPHVNSIRHEQQWLKHLPQKQGWKQHLPSFQT